MTMMLKMIVIICLIACVASRIVFPKLPFSTPVFPKEASNPTTFTDLIFSFKDSIRSKLNSAFEVFKNYSKARTSILNPHSADPCVWRKC